MGPTTDWWDAYIAAYEELDIINWQEFKNVFCAHRVPKGAIKIKRNEFLALKQGGMIMSDYVTRFTQLSRYAPKDVDTDEKKQDYFLEGLNDGL